jgi:hypothetical protein
MPFTLPSNPFSRTPKTFTFDEFVEHARERFHTDTQTSSQSDSDNTQLRTNTWLSKLSLKPDHTQRRDAARKINLALIKAQQKDQRERQQSASTSQNMADKSDNHHEEIVGPSFRGPKRLFNLKKTFQPNNAERKFFAFERKVRRDMRLMLGGARAGWVRDWTSIEQHTYVNYVRHLEVEEILQSGAWVCGLHGKEKGYLVVEGEDEDGKERVRTECFCVVYEFIKGRGAKRMVERRVLDYCS